MIQLALIGVGYWGKNYLSTINSLTDCRIKYVCSKTGKSLQSLSDDYIKTTNYEELFKYSDIDGVIIATPGATHYQIAKEFLERGFNLLIEKPLTINYKEAQNLNILKKNSKSKILVSHVFMFDPALIKSKQLIKEVGKVQYLYHEMLNNRPYYADRSVLWHLGPHTISLFLYLYQMDPIWIKALGFSDFVLINLKFPNQTQAFAKLNWSYPVKRRELVIVGSKGTIVYNDLQEKKVIYYQNIESKSKVTYPTYSPKSPLFLEIREFIDAIKENREVNKSDLDFGVRVTRILNIAEQSLQNNGKAINFK